MTHEEFWRTCSLETLTSEARIHAVGLRDAGYHPDGSPALIRALLDRVTAAEARLVLVEAVVDAARDFHGQAIRKLEDPAAPLIDRLTEQLTRLNAAEMRFRG